MSIEARRPTGTYLKRKMACACGEPFISTRAGHRMCKACAMAEKKRKDQEYKRANKEKVREYQANYHEVNKDRLKKKDAEKFQKNRERYLRTRREYNLAKPEVALECRRRARKNIATSYVVSLLSGAFNMKAKDVPPEIVELKRKQIRLLRAVKERQQPQEKQTK